METKVSLATEEAEKIEKEKAEAEERCKKELGEGWFIDFEGRASWDLTCACRKDAFDLEMESELKKKGYDAEVVWLEDDGRERSHDDDDFQHCEAVVVAKYLGGKYDAIKIL